MVQFWEHGGVEYFRDRVEVDDLCKDMRALIVDLEGRIKKDEENIKTAVKPIVEKNLSTVENQWGIDPDVIGRAHV